jgi:uncharacterized protein YkwD
MARIVALVAAVLAFGASGCGASAQVMVRADKDGCAGSNQAPDPAAEAVLHKSILCLVNAERVRQGLRPLTEDPALQAAAEGHSVDMGRRDYFEHRSPDGVEPWMRINNSGYDARVVGENLAWGQAEKGSPAETMRAWMASPGHKANILEPRYTQIGIGIAFDAPDRTAADLPSAVYTTTFGSAAVANGS